MQRKVASGILFLTKNEFLDESKNLVFVKGEKERKREREKERGWVAGGERLRCNGGLRRELAGRRSDATGGCISNG